MNFKCKIGKMIDKTAGPKKRDPVKLRALHFVDQLQAEGEGGKIKGEGGPRAPVKPRAPRTVDPPQQKDHQKPLP